MINCKLEISKIGRIENIPATATTRALFLGPLEAISRVIINYYLSRGRRAHDRNKMYVLSSGPPGTRICVPYFSNNLGINTNFRRFSVRLRINSSFPYFRLFFSSLAYFRFSLVTHARPISG